MVMISISIYYAWARLFPLASLHDSFRHARTQCQNNSLQSALWHTSRLFSDSVGHSPHVTDRPTMHLANWQATWFSVCLSVFLSVWLNCWPAGVQAGWPTYWLTRWKTHWLTHWPTHWLTDCLPVWLAERQREERNSELTQLTHENKLVLFMSISKLWVTCIRMHMTYHHFIKDCDSPI